MRFSELIELGRPASVWTYGLLSYKDLNISRKIAKFWTMPLKSGHCALCATHSDDILQHQIIECHYLTNERYIMNCKLLNTLGYNIYVNLNCLDIKSKCNILLGANWTLADPETILPISGPLIINCSI